MCGLCMVPRHYSLSGLQGVKRCTSEVCNQQRCTEVFKLWAAGKVTPDKTAVTVKHTGTVKEERVP